MGEAKRRKQLDPTWGKPKPQATATIGDESPEMQELMNLLDRLIATNSVLDVLTDVDVQNLLASADLRDELRKAKSQKDLFFKEMPSPEELFVIRDTIIPKPVLNQFYYLLDGEQFEFWRGTIEEMSLPSNWRFGMKEAAFFIHNMPEGYPLLKLLGQVAPEHYAIAFTNLCKALALAEDPYPDF